MSWNDAFIGLQGQKPISFLKSAHCDHCKEYSLWIGSKMIYPEDLSVESANQDLPEEIKEDYLEAANILAKSSRGAAALLRLSIEKLVIFLKAEGDNLNAKIGYLVTKGLSIKIQKSLDVVRVIGNEAVHPGQIDLRDDPAIAQHLFKIVNIIAHAMITEPKEINALYETVVPDDKREGIEKRDTK